MCRALRTLHARHFSQVYVGIDQPWDQELAPAIDLHTALQCFTADFGYAFSFDPNPGVLQGGRPFRGDHRYVANDCGRASVSG